jgi:predicted O-methyltransferase YrrM
MDQAPWHEVDDYFERALLGPDDVLAEALRAADAAGLPAISVSPTQGKLLQLMARGIAAARILEVGTLGGYSAIWLARALPPTGSMVTLEVDAHHAAVASATLARAGLAERVEVRVGPAADTLAAMVASGVEPAYDFVFIDADKANNPLYFDRALELTHTGSLIVVDNVVRGGAVTDAGSARPDVVGVRRVLEAMAADGRVDATAVQTVGAKGWDGMAVALVVAPAP